MTVPSILIHGALYPAPYLFTTPKRALKTSSLNINYVWQNVPVRGIFYFHMHNASLMGTAHSSAHRKNTHIIYITYPWMLLLQTHT